MKGKERVILSSFAVFLILAGSAYSAEAYRPVIDLGAANSAYPSCAYSINDNGQIVGVDSAGNQGVAARFDSTGNHNNTFLDIGGQDYIVSIAYSISDNGYIVGSGQVPGQGLPKASLFDPTGQKNNINLGTLPGHIESHALSVNNNGQIVGYSRDSSSSSTRATLFDATGNGNNIDLGTLGGSESAAYAINNKGLIGGQAEEIHGWGRAVLFDPTGGGNNIDLGPGRVNAINDNGQIVGTMEGGDYIAMMYDPTGQGNNINLGGLPEAGQYGQARAINDLGQIVGWVRNIHEYNEYFAVLFDPTGQGNNINLNTLIDPASGWTLNYAYGINNDGWIVGAGEYNGVSRAFLITPEPATVLLFALGGLALRKKH